MSFESRIRRVASEASLNIAKANETFGLLKFNMESGNVQPVYVVPFDEVWEFSTQSALDTDDIFKFPSGILAWVLFRNSKSKRAYWCIESIQDKYYLSAMTNIPDISITPAEFSRTCRALVAEVEQLELALAKLLSDN